MRSIPRRVVGAPCWIGCWVLFMAAAAAVPSQGTPIDNNNIGGNNKKAGAFLLDRNGNARTVNTNLTNPFRLFSEEEIERERRERKKRIRERRQRARELLKNAPPPKQKHLTKMTKEDIEKVGEKRRLSWFSGSGGSANSASFLADSSEDYDKWAQAYRMLGGMIDCDHDKDSSGSGSGDNNNDDGDDSSACSRWMVWAAYVNPDYQGNEYDEYFGDNPTSSLDCHNPESNWQLLGVYRQEFYQFLEQISKHLWAIDEYEYVVALAGLAYMTDYDCFAVGQTNGGSVIYAGVAPQAYGYFEMALYTDEYCLEPDTSLGMTFDDFGLTSDISLSSGDGDDGSYSWAYDWWYESQEYTLTNLNEVYEEYKYCTACIDYPTYQDGYFIGDYGTDDDDLINQCWKFYSHDSFTCEADCIAKAHAQGTIMSVQYGDTTFGKTMSGFYQGRSSSGESVSSESPFQRLMANAALTASFLLFVATFLAFAVARRSRYRESRSSRSRRLLDDDGEGRSRRSRRSSKHVDGDGLFRANGGSSRNRSGSRTKSSSSRKHSSSGRKSRSSSKGERSSRKHSKRSRSYEPPKEEGRSRSKSASHTPDEYL